MPELGRTGANSDSNVRKSKCASKLMMPIRGCFTPVARKCCAKP
ncbi:Uncharacterised protein [Vibrio cholerae]|nr:Uncharacterised protein [Vibrio cholerae]